MSKGQILEELPKLRPEERDEVLDRLHELAEKDLLDGGGFLLRRRRYWTGNGKILSRTPTPAVLGLKSRREFEAVRKRELADYHSAQSRGRSAACKITVRQRTARAGQAIPR